jgi:hypothetical protein
MFLTVPAINAGLRQQATPLLDSGCISLGLKPPDPISMPSVAAPGETPPANPGDLRRSFHTKRKKDVIEFGFGDSGKTAFFAVQLENKGKKGPWEPLRY